MGSRAVLQTCAAFFCGTLFGLMVYTFSKQGSQVFQLVAPIPKVLPLRINDNKPFKPESSHGRRPLDNASPSNETHPSVNVSPGNKPRPHDNTFPSNKHRPHDNVSPSNKLRLHDNVSPSNKPLPHDNVSPSNQKSSQTALNDSASAKVTTDMTSSADMVLILAYMRTGSTLTGDVIQQHKDTFYLFEPFYNIWHGKISTYTNGTKRKFKTDEEKYEESVHQLKAWYTCDLNQVSMETFKHIFMTYGFKTTPTRTCLYLRKRTSFKKSAYDDCIAPLINRCKKSTVRVVKTIRLTAKSIEGLLVTLPRLKVIHLVRDPRGILTSRMKLHFQSTARTSLLESSSSTCNRITKDAKDIAHLQTLFPGRFKTLRYEEIAYHPIETVKSIYEFIGLTPTKDILKYVTSITSSSKNVEKDYNNQRKNSILTSNAWRLKVMKNVTDIIDNACGDVYKKYGYITPKSTKELKDVNGTRLWLEDIDI